MATRRINYGRVTQMHLEGYSQREIARKVRCSQPSVAAIVKKYRVQEGKRQAEVNAKWATLREIERLRQKDRNARMSPPVSQVGQVGVNSDGLRFQIVAVDRAFVDRPYTRAIPPSLFSKLKAALTGLLSRF